MVSGSGTLSPADLWNGKYSTQKELRRLQAILSGLPTTAEQDIDILARMARPPLALHSDVCPAHCDPTLNNLTRK